MSPPPPFLPIYQSQFYAAINVCYIVTLPESHKLKSRTSVVHYRTTFSSILRHLAETGNSATTGNTLPCLYTHLSWIWGPESCYWLRLLISGRDGVLSGSSSPTFRKNIHPPPKFRSPKCSLCRSQWPRGLKHELSSFARTLGSWIRTPIKAWMSLCAFILRLCCLVFMQRPCDGLITRARSPTDCVQIRELKKRPGLNKGLRAIKENVPFPSEFQTIMLHALLICRRLQHASPIPSSLT
jgi:hypothetical protein